MTTPDDARRDDAESTPPGPKREVPADALSAGEFDRLKALVEGARTDPAAVVVPEAPRPVVPIQPEPEYYDEDDDDDRPSRLGRILLNSVLAVVLGGLLGVSVAWASGRLGGSAPPPGDAAPSRALTAVASVPPSQGRSPSAGPTAAGVNNPGLAPMITGLDIVGTSVVLRWRDPTRSGATFIVIRVVQGRGQPVTTLPPGSTEFVLEDIDPAAGPYCFLVIAVVGQERGVSPTRCAGQGI